MDLAVSPAVSVLMSVKDSDEFLREAIDSILRQTFSDFEFIIIDDASSDKSFEIIQSYTDQRLRSCRNEQNLGVTKNLNIGISKARGKYIARMDADDISRPDRLEKQVALMESNSSIGVVGNWFTYFGDQERLIKLPVSHPEIINAFFRINPLAHPTVMIRKSVLNQSKIEYNESIPVAQDYDLWLRLSTVTELHNLPESLLSYRIHQDQVSVKKLKQQQYYKDKALADFLANEAKLDPSEDLLFREFMLNRTVDNLQMLTETLYQVEERNKHFRSETLHDYLVKKLYVYLADQDLSIKEILFVNKLQSYLGNKLYGKALIKKVIK